MRGILIGLFVAFLAAAPATASQEGMLAFGTFQVSSPGIGESGPIVVSGRQGYVGLESLTVQAFGKSYSLTKAQLAQLSPGGFNGLQISYERGYQQLGGRTLYLKLSKGFTSRIVNAVLIIVTEHKGITIDDQPK